MWEIVYTPLLASHLLLVNLGAAGHLLSVPVHWLACQNDDDQLHAIGRRFAGWTMVALLLGTVLGFGLLGLGWWTADANYWRGWQQLPASQYAWAGAEWLFSLVCQVIYVGWWTRSRRWRGVHATLGLLGATNLLYHFPTLMTGLAVLRTQPAVDGMTLDRGQFLQLIGEAEVLSRIVHVVVASIAVAGVSLMVAALRESKAQDGAVRAIRWGAGTALVATLAQLGLGTWVLVSLPVGDQKMLLGGNINAMAIFLLGLMGTLWLLHHLAAITGGDTSREMVWRVAGGMILVVTLMVATLRQLEVQPAEAADRSAADKSPLLEEG